VGITHAHSLGLNKNKKEETMKRYVRGVTLGGLIASLLLGVPILRGGRSGVVATVRAQVPKPEACSVATLNGAYGFFRTGITSVGPLAAAGIATFDGKGGSTARQTIRKNGITASDLFTDPPLSGPYEVDSDCAGRVLNPNGTASPILWSSTAATNSSSSACRMRMMSTGS
jgi:hypothetical protein